MKKSIILGIISIVLIAVCVVLAVVFHNAEYSLWLQEYNAQIAANGIYKEDLHLLNQYVEYVRISFLLVGSVLSGITGLVLLGVAIAQAFEYYEYNHRWSSRW